MLQGKHWAAMFILALAVLVGTDVQGGGKGKKAATAEEAIKLIEQAFKAGDGPATLDQMAEPSRTLHEFKLTLLLLDENLARVFEEKFGKDPKGFGPTVKQLLQSLKAIRIYSKQDKVGKVEMKVWMTWEHEPGKPFIVEQPWTAVKQGDAWKLLVPDSAEVGKVVKRKSPDGKDVEVEVSDLGKEPTPKDLDYLRSSLPKYKAMMEKLTAQIKNGAYKTRLEAGKGVDAALEAFRQANPPPKLDTKENKK